MKPSTLLVELLTEELPPKSLKRLGTAFGQGIFQELSRQLFTASTECQMYMTPRRLSVVIPDVLDCQPRQQIERKGPSVTAAYDSDGKPTKALEGFMRSCQTTQEGLSTSEDGQYIVFKAVKEGEKLEVCLATIVEEVAKSLPIPKMMHWGDTDYTFVRPVQGLVMLLGDHVIPGTVFGQSSRKITQGHRFLGEGQITISCAERYELELETRGSVITSFERRQTLIRDALELTASEVMGASVLMDQALLDEVTALVEMPAVYLGKFEADFLKVPQECLVLSMKHHQKYFPLVDEEGKLLPQFLIVSNMPIDNANNIIAGNERVLRARLSDARFFYEQDIKTSLESRLSALEHVVYHNLLGSQRERAERLSLLARHIASFWNNADSLDEQAARAALLCKTDLISDMVGEFPELQGIMGRYYALTGGESEAVAHAIEQHYWPRFSGDKLPETSVAICCALADKLDILVGIFGIGLLPTGDKDPFGLRRQTLGILRILMELKLGFSISALLKAATDNFDDKNLKVESLEKIQPFIMDRLKYDCLDRGFEPAVVEAVLSLHLDRVDWVLPKLQSVTDFLNMEEAHFLAETNKRIVNILRKNAPDLLPEIEASLFVKSEETALYQLMLDLEPSVHDSIMRQHFSEALKQLSVLKAPIDAFFDQVMVIDQDENIKNNRLSLLSRLAILTNCVADLSKLAV